MHGFNPADFRLVRHGPVEIDPLDTFRHDRALFEAYQAFQIEGRFKNAKYIACFAPHHGTQALFLGVWRIDGEVRPHSRAPESQLALVERFNWPPEGSYYTLTELEAFKELSTRLVIDWGKAAVSWVQKNTSKSVVAIFPPHSIAEFESYAATLLMREDLVEMSRNPTNNHTWHRALRSVNGIYCITDMRNGRNYVGSAYGKDGIWGRWSDYAENGHGGNKLLLELIEKKPDAVDHLQFSILEILPANSTADDAVAKENLWKQKLGSRIGGYNDN
ncbi:MAG: hypothetical protein C0605_09820 [Hyphomicrobiales bacterium]|nr:MAG: hypothetical protein C0605_09820 [Hyphomicrobiales bacterium]